MNARNASPVTSPLPLVGALENVERFPWGRVDVIRFSAAIKWMISVAAWLMFSIVLLLTGFILALATALLAFLRFTGGDVTVELVAMCASGFPITLWGSSASWERMWGVSSAHG